MRWEYPEGLAKDPNPSGHFFCASANSIITATDSKGNSWMVSLLSLIPISGENCKTEKGCSSCSDIITEDGVVYKISSSDGNEVWLLKSVYTKEMRGYVM